MDKLKPAYLLDDIKKLIKDDRYLLTVTAQKTAYSVGYTSEMVADVILNLERNDFYKSTNEFNNPKAWQDVYKTRVENYLDVYIKLKITEINRQTLLILSFKENEGYSKKRREY
ncbi:MAG: type II toxin-antitoxin system MqsR family toxin [Desulfobacteraceae bacterium]|nr:type II toxin-antitoxin system MqsR family toxin [Desulfobacteraceae bacterium]